MRTTTAWQPSEIPIRNTQCDVVVFGAGMAGLAAARALCASGIETCVLEARRRVGGRAWTVQGTLAGGESTEPLELGAEFVHGRAPETAALAAAAHVELVESAPRVRWWLDRRLVDRPDLDAVVEGAVEAAAATVKDRPDRSLVEALDATRLQEPSRSLARQFVENFEGAAGSNLSARALALGTGLERSRRVEGGYSRLAEGLAASLPNGVLRLGRVVQSVRWRPDGVEVRTVSADGMTPPALVRCRCAIVALPLAVIRRVQFDPPLRRDCGKSVSLARLGTGRATRVVLCFREPFWRERLAAPFFVHAPGESFPVLWTGPHRETRTIVAWAGGPASSALAVRSPGELAEVALASLSRVFGS
ncbi:MAG TPA: FAD-dependent oxidoreductase, partial [Polyangiaceae bacterium]|nr:FAD-dependent oxidoreductase [Polyangiaceae bacterium]